MEQLDLNEIQAYLMHDYGHMFFSRFVLLQVTDAPSAKHWISDISHQLAYATSMSTDQSEDTLLNIAVTASGFKALGMHPDNVNAFSREFREGMISEHRTRMLGDIAGSSPDQWLWGNEKKIPEEPVHLLLLVFGKDEETCIRFYDDLKEKFSNRGLKESIHIDGRILKDNKEHFGFKDGISQPIIKGSGQTGPKPNMIAAGEFILGYKNVYDVLPQTPLIMKDEGDLNLLPPDAGGSGKKDLGRNGTYLVIRQLEQDVNAFWSFMNKKTQNEDGSVNVDESLKLSAKIMGRWPSGAPITSFPDADPGILMEDNDFGYAKLDKDGLKCPFGAHIRRNNPRDSFEDLGIKESYKLSNRHRIIRRARLYGEPFIGSPENHKPEGEVGLLFNCFNADISRQFEFLQYTWANIPKTKELYNDPDPIIGVKEFPVEGETQNFTIQDSPVNRTISGLERFVKVKGGAYFFFPSYSALRYTASI